VDQKKIGNSTLKESTTGHERDRVSSGGDLPRLVPGKVLGAERRTTRQKFGGKGGCPKLRGIVSVTVG